MAGSGAKYKTRFPTSRIKKIMQADEEIGKIAQSTPIVVSRAVELFLQSIIDEALQLVLPEGSKPSPITESSTNAKIPSAKFTPETLKKLIHGEPLFDFLKDVVKDVADERPVVLGNDPSSPAKSPKNTRDLGKVSEEKNTPSKGEKRRRTARINPINDYQSIETTVVAENQADLSAAEEGDCVQTITLDDDKASAPAESPLKDPMRISSIVGRSESPIEFHI
jgi:hypothetical protein